MSFFGDVLNTAEQNLSGVGTAVSSYFSGKPIQFTIPSPSLPSVGSIGSYFPGALQSIENAGSGVGSELQNLFGSIWSGAGKLATGAGTVVRNAASGLATGAGNVASAVGQTGGRFLGGIFSGLGLPTMILILAAIAVAVFVYVKTRG